MRPSEIGYETVYTSVRKNGLNISSKKFLIKDLYLIQKLKLRPDKSDKDHERMYKFAKKVLKVPVKKSDSIDQIYKKCKNKIRGTHLNRFVNRPYFTNRFLKMAMKVKPFRYQSTPPKRRIRTKKSKGTNYIFNIDTLKWKKTTSNMYIKNEGQNGPYGYKKSRNYKMPKVLVKKATNIEKVGLKKETLLNKIKKLLKSV
jgi:hypothetical protein